jgi:single-strand DNA-binding protein
MAQGDVQITVIGNLTADPELRFTPSGHAVANFTVASTPRVFDKATNEWKDGDALSLRCSVWRQYAENVAESLQRGMQVVVTGRLKVREYEGRDGVKGKSVECEVDDVGPTLRWATAKVTKVSRSGGGGGGFGAPAGGGGNDPWATGAPAASSGGGDWGGAPSGGGATDEPPF